MQITSKGQVTIPQELRDQLDIRPGDEVTFSRDGDGMHVAKQAGSPSRGQRAVARLREHGRRSWQSELTTDELMALLRGE